MYCGVVMVFVRLASQGSLSSALGYIKQAKGEVREIPLMMMSV